MPGGLQSVQPRRNFRHLLAHAIERDFRGIQLASCHLRGTQSQHEIQIIGSHKKSRRECCDCAFRLALRFEYDAPFSSNWIRGLKLEQAIELCLGLFQMARAALRYAQAEDSAAIVRV